MPFFVILILISLGFYVYYKIKFFRTNRPMERRWISAKSSISLGLFVSLFGINQFFIHQSTVSFIIGILFLAVGGGSVWAGYRLYRNILPHVIEEAERMRAH
jgi:uncharacterized membrane-anchored protein